MKKLLVSIMMLTLVFSVSCTSKKDMDTDQETAEVTDPALDVEGADAAADMDSMESSKDTDDFAGDEEVIADTDGLPDDSLAAESTGAEGEEVVLDDASSTSSDVVTEDIAGTPTDDGSITADTTDTSSSDESVFDASSTDSVPADSSLTDTSGESTALLEAPKPNIPLQKIKDVPYSQNGTLLNTVYIGRQGDTVSSVSMKVFGSDRSADLKQVNSFLNRREVRVGDKIYYNSSKRPQDAERMLTYYEDNGIPAQTYVSKSGENIRTVSKNLLGDKDSWKEIWATNLAVESKGDLPEGTELRYWPDGGAQMPLADTQVPPPAPSEVPADFGQQPQQDVAANAPADDFAMPEDMGAAGTVAAEPPPPPPPPPAQPAKQVASSTDKDMTFMLSAGGLLLVGVGIILAVMRRSRARKMSMNTNTQI